MLLHWRKLLITIHLLGIQLAHIGRHGNGDYYYLTARRGGCVWVGMGVLGCEMIR